jgi:hypothetical protein
MFLDLTNAVCYYTRKLYAWIGIIATLVTLAIAICATFGIGIVQSKYTDYLDRTHIMPVWAFILYSIASLAILVATLPRIFYYGPSLAITEEGIHLMLWGGHLVFIGWDELSHTESVSPRPRLLLNTPRYGVINSGYYILIFPKDVDLLFVRIEERQGRLPFLAKLQYLIMRTGDPFRIRTDTLIDGDLRQIENQLDAALVKWRDRHHQTHQY